MMPLLGTLSGDAEYAVFGSANTARTLLQGSASHANTTTTSMTTGGGQVSGAWYNQPLSLASTRTISFTSTMSAGGADGFTVAFLSTASYPSAPALGSTGGNLGIINGAGLYIEFITYTTDALRITPFGQSMHYGSNLYSSDWSGTHTISVRVTSAGLVTVRYDGAQIASQTVAIPATAWVGVTSATGGSSEVHSVSLGIVS